MILQLLGTGAADGIPAFYSDTRVSAHARQFGGKDVRSRASALIDGALKLDLGPDTWSQIAQHGVDARDWTSLLFTHSDADHFAIDELQYALYPFNDMEYVGFTVYGNNVICRRILERYPDWPFEVVMTKSFCPFQTCDYLVTPVEANHMHTEDAHNFIVESGGKRILYATDTGVWYDRTWDFLAGHRIDLLVIECTEGFVPTPYNGHLDAKECVAVVERLRRQGTLTAGSRVVTTHHSHNGDATHAELESYFALHGIEVGYDGLSLEL